MRILKRPEDSPRIHHNVIVLLGRSMLPLGTKTSKSKKLTVRLTRHIISLSCGDKRKKLTRYYRGRESPSGSWTHAFYLWRKKLRFRHTLYPVGQRPDLTVRYQGFGVGLSCWQVGHSAGVVAHAQSSSLLPGDFLCGPVEQTLRKLRKEAAWQKRKEQVISVYPIIASLLQSDPSGEHFSYDLIYILSVRPRISPLLPLSPISQFYSFQFCSSQVIDQLTNYVSSCP